MNQKTKWERRQGEEGKLLQMGKWAGSFTIKRKTHSGTYLCVCLSPCNLCSVTVTLELIFFKTIDLRHLLLCTVIIESANMQQGLGMMVSLPPCNTLPRRRPHSLHLGLHFRAFQIDLEVIMQMYFASHLVINSILTTSIKCIE